MTFAGDESGDVSFSFAKGASTYFVAEVIRLISAEKREGATLLMDEFGSPRQLPTELRRILKARTIPRHFKQIVAKRSRNELLIQVGDLIAGALLRHFAQGDSETFHAIQGKLQTIAEFPEI